MKDHALTTRVLLSCALIGLAGTSPHAEAMTQILPEAQVEIDRQTLLELTSTFDQAEEAIRARNLDGLMALYSDHYRYHGMNKADVRKIWAKLLKEYELIANIHTFSAIRATGAGPKSLVEITCAGALWATSKDSKARIPIDSWHQEVHRLVKEHGTWRIIGNPGGTAKRPQLFGTAPHPLF